MEKTNISMETVNNVVIANGRGKKIHVEYNGEVYDSQNTLRLKLNISPNKFYKMLKNGEITRTDKDVTVVITKAKFVKLGSKIPVIYKGVVYESQNVLRKALKISPAKFYEMLKDKVIVRISAENGYIKAA